MATPQTILVQQAASRITVTTVLAAVGSFVVLDAVIKHKLGSIIPGDLFNNFFGLMDSGPTTEQSIAKAHKMIAKRINKEDRKQDRLKNKANRQEAIVETFQAKVDKAKHRNDTAHGHLVAAAHQVKESKIRKKRLDHQVPGRMDQHLSRMLHRQQNQATRGKHHKNLDKRITMIKAKEEALKNPYASIGMRSRGEDISKLMRAKGALNQHQQKKFNKYVNTHIKSGPVRRTAANLKYSFANHHVKHTEKKLQRKTEKLAHKKHHKDNTAHKLSRSQQKELEWKERDEALENENI